MNKLSVGDKAPSFRAENQSGEMIALEDFVGKKVILYFYPKDNTSGCTAEACSLRDGYRELTDMGFVVVGVSPDSVKSHVGFINKHSLPFTLLSDADHAIAENYGTWGLKKFMGREYYGIIRKTFIIDQNGVIEKIFDKVDTKKHFEQISDSYK